MYILKRLKVGGGKADSTTSCNKYNTQHNIRYGGTNITLIYPLDRIKT